MASEIRKSWMRHWHSVIDDAFGAELFFDLEKAHKDPDNDFRMHFMTWELPDEGLRRCIEVLPHGNEMCNRSIEMRRIVREKRLSIPEHEALELFQRGLHGYAHFVSDEELLGPIRIKHVTNAELLIPPGCRVAVVLEYVDWSDGLPVENLEAASFLRETLYRLANCYDVADYVKWPLQSDPQSIDPFRGFALLAATGKYYSMLDEEGPVLFVVTD